MKKILIVSTNAIGDTYISLSCLNPLYDFFKDAEFTVVCMKESSFLQPFFGLANAIFIKKKNIFNTIKFLYLLRKTEYDYCFSFFPGRLNSFLSIMSKSKNKYYYRNFNKILDWYMHIQFVYVNNLKTNICWTPNLKYLDRVKLILDMIIDKKYILEKPRLTLPNLIPLFSDRYVVINFSSKEKLRELNVDFITALSHLLYKEYNLKIIIIDYHNKYKNIDPSYISIHKSKNIIDTLGLLLNSFFVITVDSFLIHIVDAYQIPSLCIFGSTNPECVIQNYSKLKIVKRNSIAEINLSDISIYFDGLIKGIK